ncbi:MAG: hypothetical protein ACREK1_00120 [Longimicrobiales bacterium]
MFKTLMTVSVVAMLHACAALSCAQGDAGRDLPLAPDAGATQTTGSSDLLGLESSSDEDSDTDTDYIRIEDVLPTDLPSLQVSSIIGLLGGEVHLAGHVIQVPAGAVSLPTVFTLTLATNGYVEVDISALTTDLLGNTVNIGEQGFKKPVTLSLTYARATNVTDPSRLKLMRLKSDGKHEILKSKVSDGTKLVSAKLDHFSRYCMVAD